MCFNGTLTTWNDERGFGFNTATQGGQELFVHNKEIPAVAGQCRAPESTLHLLSLAGGWPGALLAQQALRHKTSKSSFITGFWLMVVLNVAAFVVWHDGLLPVSRPPGLA